MSKWQYDSGSPDVAPAWVRKTRHCVIRVVPRTWSRKGGVPARWATRCADEPRLVDLPNRPDRMDPGYEVHVGYTSSVEAAKSAAVKSAERAELRRRKLHPDHAHIESIARDADKQARAIAKTNPTEAKRLREKARTIREEKFAGRRRRKARR